jgi:ureidoacrylate peracid hydrolase
MNVSESALVLIEFQNEFASPGGKLHSAVAGVMESNGTLPHAHRLVMTARERGLFIVHVPISFKADYSELSPQPYGILANVIAGQAFQQGTWNAQIIDSLAPRPGEVVIEGKRGLCGFASTNLDFVLRQRGIRQIALAGFLTNCCVESTMRTGYEMGYRVITVTDATATLSDEEQRLSVTKNFPMFSTPMTHDAVIAALAS